MKTMGIHIDDSGDSTLAAISLLFVVLAFIGIGTIGAVIAIISGGISIVINWPKFRERIKQIKLKRKK